MKSFYATSKERKHLKSATGSGARSGPMSKTTRGTQFWQSVYAWLWASVLFKGKTVGLEYAA